MVKWQKKSAATVVWTSIMDSRLVYCLTKRTAFGHGCI